MQGFRDNVTQSKLKQNGYQSAILDFMLSLCNTGHIFMVQLFCIVFFITYHKITQIKNGC